MYNSDLLGITGLVIILSAVFGGMYFVKKEQCNQKTVSFADHSYGIFSGCMVVHNDKWLPLENIRGFDDK